MEGQRGAKQKFYLERGGGDIKGGGWVDKSFMAFLSLFKTGCEIGVGGRGGIYRYSQKEGGWGEDEYCVTK